MSTIYIVGGGHSLKDFNWDLLKDRNVIAVNRAYEKVPDAKWIYFSDLRFWQWHRKYLVNHKGRKITGNYRIIDKDVTIFKFTGSKGLEIKATGLRTGNNSGFAAINLAYHLGAKLIVLLGFDMNVDKGTHHWHSGYPTKNRNNFKDMIKYFETIAKPLENLNIEVLNASPNSAIECFDKVSLKDIFDE